MPVIIRDGNSLFDSFGSPTPIVIISISIPTIISIFALLAAIGTILSAILACACCSQKKRDQTEFNQNLDAAVVPPPRPSLEEEPPRVSSAAAVVEEAPLDQSQIRKQQVLAKALLGLLKKAPPTATPTAKTAPLPISKAGLPLKTQPLAVTKTVSGPQQTGQPSAVSATGGPVSGEDTAAPTVKSGAMPKTNFVAPSRQDYMTLALADSKVFGKGPAANLAADRKDYMTLALADSKVFGIVKAKDGKGYVKLGPKKHEPAPGPKLTPVDTLFLANSLVFDKKKKAGKGKLKSEVEKKVKGKTKTQKRKSFRADSAVKKFVGPKGHESIFVIKK